MAVTLEQVRATLEAEEPDYNKAAKTLGTEALPHLERLITSDHSMIASKAAYLAGLIGTEQSVPAIERAARSGDVRVRIAAAAAVKNMESAAASDVLLSLIDDSDVGVQKVALRSMPAAPSAVLRARVEGLSAAKTDSHIRSISREVLGLSPTDASAAPPRARSAAGGSKGAGGAARKSSGKGGGAKKGGAGKKGAGKKSAGKTGGSKKGGSKKGGGGGRKGRKG
jgi:HEAT repeat protein